MNQAGGDILTFEGKGFDKILDYTLIIFGDDTLCTPISSTFESLTCQVDGFNLNKLNKTRADSEGGFPSAVIMPVTVYVNGDADIVLQVELRPALMKATGVVPSTISPINAVTI